MNTIEQVRKSQPLIHHLTNQVVMNFTANGLLSFGGSPIMAKEVKEATEMANVANGILMNIGTIIESEVEAMLLAGKTANQRGIPVVLDPVGVAATPFRQQIIATLTDEINFTAIKGNAGEMASIVDIAWKTKGVESIDENVHLLEEVASNVAKKYDTMAIVTGEVDVICDNEQVQTNETGHLYLTKITGAGCLLGSIVTACLTASNEPVEAAYDALHHYGRAAERAASMENVHGTGTFIAHFIDQLAT